MIGLIKRIFRGRKVSLKQQIAAVDFEKIRKEIQNLDRPALKNKLFKLTAAYNINKEATDASGLENVLNLLVDRIAQLMSVGIVSLMLLAKNKSGLVMKIARGLDRGIVKNLKVKLGEGVSGWVAQTGQPLLIKDISKDPRFSKRNGKYHNDSLLSVPLKLQDKVIGVINVNNKINRDIFNEEDLDTLNMIANLSTAAVVNASLKDDIKEIDQLRTSFIANVSHELRTPLAALKESVTLILEEIAGGINDQQRRFLSLAVKNIDRLGRLIDNILDFSKVEAETKEMKRSLFDVGEIVGIAVSSLKPLADKQNIKIKSFLPNKKVEIWGDNDKLYEVITNFIDNAIKYNRQKGKVEVRLEDVGDDAKIYISDTGIGIPEGELDKIFDRFSRVQGSFKGNVKSTGLGLSIVKDIIEMHGGQIAVESKPDKGSKFTISLPKNLRVRR